MKDGDFDGSEADTLDASIDADAEATDNRYTHIHACMHAYIHTYILAWPERRFGCVRVR